MSEEELFKGCADMLRSLRERSGLSKAKIADLLYIDPHTWASYESGKSAPSVPEFIRIYNTLHEDALPDVLRYLYPDTYCRAESKDDIHRSSVHYWMSLASELSLRELNYLVCGGSGSNIEAQMQEYYMAAKLPLKYRIVIAEMILSLWQMAKDNNEITASELEPDIGLFKEAISKARRAVKDGKDSYTTAIR